MGQPISIVIPAFNQLEFCRQCLASIRLSTRRPYKLILVDNGSTDGVGEFFDAIHGAHVIHSETNRGFAGGINLGLAAAEGHVVILNSDTLVPQGWLTRLEQPLLQADDIGMVGPMTNYASGGQHIGDLVLNGQQEIEAFAAKLAIEKAGQTREVTRLVAFCIMIRDSVLQNVGLFDEAYGIGNFEDDDYCVRVLRAGYRLVIAESCFVFHYGHRTFAGMGYTDDTLRTLINTNEQVFLEKWGTHAHERSKAEQLNRQARRALEQSDGTEALRLFKAGIEAFPFFAGNHNDLGALLWQIGEKDRAYQCFAQALKCDPGHREARENLLDAARALGKKADAETVLTELDRNRKDALKAPGNQQ